ncbi:uncharacterized protein LOC113019414 isoform X2 [Astatotilapia calliptera]|uniref:uncharacterized protein LOC113019414 isoform X2 n=1 Tax=Astatotilapia calliptera TaxID=8154 RepID=UPI000E40EF1E|nr:uncharacterized protein LOC113019414 isoform X2 [Astatotilapia calliptera]
MSRSVLPLLFFVVCSTQAFFFLRNQNPGFYGTATYYTKDADNGSAMLTVRYTLNNRYCYNASLYNCQNNSCENVLNKISEISGEWCQMEEIYYGEVPDNDVHLVMLHGDNWMYASSLTSGANETNGVMSNITTEALIDLRTRSDTGKKNSSPQTAILPVMIVPSNCQMNFTLLMFDPDGDKVKCRFGNTSECQPCNLPSFLTILPSSCTLSFSPTNSTTEGLYVVQLMMEDFPIKNITLTQTNGTETKITTNDAISKVPVQFILRVTTAVTSCAEGEFLPKFLSPTPANGAQLYNRANQTLEINITAETTNSTMSELLFTGPSNVTVIKTGPAEFSLRLMPSVREYGGSYPFCFVIQADSKISELLFTGPSNVTVIKTGPAEFSLRWMPSVREYGGSYPFCFVIQADSNHSGTKYYSELRCVIVSVGNKSEIIIATTTAATLTSEATTTTAATLTSGETTTTGAIQTSGEASTTGAIQTSEETTTTGAIQTSGETTTTGAIQTSGEASTTGAIQTSGETTTTGAIQTSGEASTTGAIQTSGETTTTGAIQTSGETTTTGAIQTSGEASTTGAIQTSEETTTTGATLTSEATYTTGAIQTSGETTTTAATLTSEATYTTGAIQTSEETTTTGAIQTSGETTTTAATLTSEATYTTGAIQTSEETTTTGAIQTSEETTTTAATHTIILIMGPLLSTLILNK